MLNAWSFGMVTRPCNFPNNAFTPKPDGTVEITYFHGTADWTHPSQTLERGRPDRKRIWFNKSTQSREMLCLGPAILSFDTSREPPIQTDILVGAAVDNDHNPHQNNGNRRGADKKFTVWYGKARPILELFQIAYHGTSLTELDIRDRLRTFDGHDDFWGLARIIFYGNFRCFAELDAAWTGPPTAVVPHLRMKLRCGNVREFVMKCGAFFRDPSIWSQYVALVPGAIPPPPPPAPHSYDRRPAGLMEEDRRPEGLMQDYDRLVEEDRRPAGLVEEDRRPAELVEEYVPMPVTPRSRSRSRCGRGEPRSPPYAPITPPMSPPRVPISTDVMASLAQLSAMLNGSSLAPPSFTGAELTPPTVIPPSTLDAGLPASRSSSAQPSTSQLLDALFSRASTALPASLKVSNVLPATVLPVASTIELTTVNTLENADIIANKRDESEPVIEGEQAVLVRDGIVDASDKRLLVCEPNTYTYNKPWPEAMEQAIARTENVVGSGETIKTVVLDTLIPTQYKGYRTLKRPFAYVAAGGTRDVVLRDKEHKESQRTFAMAHGNVMVVRDTQGLEMSIPKRARADTHTFMIMEW